MKILFIWLLYLALQICGVSARELAAEHVESELHSALDEEDSVLVSGDILLTATQHAKDIVEAERKAAEDQIPSKVSERHSKFGKSTTGVTNAGQSASVMLDVMKEKLKQWLQDQADVVHKRAPTYEDFWKWVWSGEEDVLKPNTENNRNPDSIPRPHREPDVCPFFKTNCPKSTLKYRTFEGTCNNQRPGYTQWGSKDRAQNRMIHPDYADGIGEPRKAISGHHLPNARKVARLGLATESSPSGVSTVLLMMMGQFLDHDITLTPAATFFNAYSNISSVFCGTDGCGEGLPENAGKDCFPILIDEDDPMYPDVKCMSFIRSGAVTEDGCRQSPRQQANAITAWIDASQTYGSSKDEADKLRDLRNSCRGRMMVSQNPMSVDYSYKLKPLLPFADNSESSCSGVNETIHCFHAGDVRQNEQIGLSSMHTLLVRLHNLIEGKLHTANPDWSGQKLYDESRRIVGALWQHLVYNEYLPAILGKKNMEKYGLETGHTADYDDQLCPDIYNVFSTAAFRFGHTQIPNSLGFINARMDNIITSDLSNLFFNPYTLYECPQKRSGISGIDSCLLGMAHSAAEGFDGNFAEQISNHLFAEMPPHGWGLDLRALNIQRGRDHGIPGYTKWRQECGLPVPNGFDDLNDMMQIGCAKRFSSLYEDVADIDLFAAGVCEIPEDGAIVGPTFACIIGKQFKALKDGDRFFYENGKNGFKIWHKQEIRKYSISRLLCDTLDRVKEIQPYALWQSYSKLSSSNQEDHKTFYEQIKMNERVKCSKIKNLDYDVFAKDYQPFSVRDRRRAPIATVNTEVCKSQLDMAP